MSKQAEWYKIIVILFKYMMKVAISIGIISIVLVLIVYYTRLDLSNTFLGAGILSGVIGSLSYSGSAFSQADSINYLGFSLNYKTQDKMARDYLKLRDSGLNFVVFMFLVGVGLVVISSFLN